MDGTEAVHTYLTTAETSPFQGQSVTIVEGWQGVDNLLWRVQSDEHDVVLKLFVDAGQVRSRRQFEGQQIFHPAGFACRPLWYDWQPDGLARPVLIYEWAEGTVVEEPGTETVLETARILASVHSVGVNDVSRLSPNPISLDYFWRLLEASIAKIDEWLIELEADRLRTTFSALAEAATAVAAKAIARPATGVPSAIHGDPVLENFVLANDTVTLLDWERFGLGDPALETAVFLFKNQAVMQFDSRARWLATYLDHSNRPGLDRRITVYSRLLPFQSACYLLDGLRQLSLTAQGLSEQREALPFLQETLAASLAQASRELGQGRQDFSADVQILFDRYRRR